MIWNVRDPDMKDNTEGTLIEVINIIKEINAAMRVVCESLEKMNN